MQDLIEKLEKASAPDRELDGLIYCLQPVIAECWPHWTSEQRENLTMYYTASIDAALTLVPEGCDVELYFDNPQRRGSDTWLAWLAKVGNPIDDMKGKSDTAAIALCIAALKARLAVSAVKPHQGKPS